MIDKIGTEKPRGIFHRKRATWELSQAGWGGHEVFLHLSDGWEPFTVTSQETTDGTNFNVQYIIWFRRRVRA